MDEINDCYCCNCKWMTDGVCELYCHDTMMFGYCVDWKQEEVGN